MEQFLTIQNITFTLGVLGILFTVYKYFRDPDIESDKKSSIFDYRLTTIEKQLSNDIQHFDAMLKDVHQDISEVKTKVVQLATIIDERVPRVVK